MCVRVCAHLRLFMPIQDVGLPRYLLGQDKTRLFTLSHHHPPSHFTVNVRVLGIYPIPQLWLNRRLPHGSGNAHCIALHWTLSLHLPTSQPRSWTGCSCLKRPLATPPPTYLPTYLHNYIPVSYLLLHGMVSSRLTQLLRGKGGIHFHEKDFFFFFFFFFLNLPWN